MLTSPRHALCPSSGKWIREERRKKGKATSSLVLVPVPSRAVVSSKGLTQLLDHIISAGLSEGQRKGVSFESPS